MDDISLINILLNKKATIEGIIPPSTKWDESNLPDKF